MRRARRRGMPQINIVPLMDVLTILIFFFLMTMQFRQMMALSITPPKVETAGKTTAQHILTLAVTKEGKFLFEGRPIEPADITPTLKRRAQGNTDEKEILVLADEDTPIKYLTQAMDDCRQAGYTKIKLQSR